ncbi:hypothetical protein RBB50_012668 [Rhinocladiella similis]
MSPRDYSHVDGTECQDSPNEDTMLSEPVIPPLEGYPNVNDFDELVKRYVQDLSPKRQDKALINARRATNIRHVLINKKTTSIESVQFRFWVKKTFTLQSADGKPLEHRKICHKGKPVAVQEKLFKILTKAHKQCQHGGRDKTLTQVQCGAKGTDLQVRQAVSNLPGPERYRTQLTPRVGEEPRNPNKFAFIRGDVE